MRRRRVDEAPDGLSPAGTRFSEEMRARNSLKLTRPCALPSHGGSLSLFLFLSLARWLAMRRNATDDDELLNCARRIINEDSVRWSIGWNKKFKREIKNLLSSNRRDARERLRCLGLLSMIVDGGWKKKTKSIEFKRAVNENAAAELDRRPKTTEIIGNLFKIDGVFGFSAARKHPKSHRFSFRVHSAAPVAARRRKCWKYIYSSLFESSHTARGSLGLLWSD